MYVLCRAQKVRRCKENEKGHLQRDLWSPEACDMICFDLQIKAPYALKQHKRAHKDNVFTVMKNETKRKIKPKLYVTSVKKSTKTKTKVWRLS